MKDADDFIRTLLDRIRTSYPGVRTRGEFDGHEVEVEIEVFPYNGGVTLTRPWVNLSTPDQRTWFEARLRELIEKVLR